MQHYIFEQIKDINRKCSS